MTGRRMIVGAAMMVGAFLALPPVVEAESVLLRARDIPGDIYVVEANTQITIQQSSRTPVQTIPKILNKNIVSEVNMTIENSPVEEGVITIVATLNSGSLELTSPLAPPVVKSIPPGVISTVTRDIAGEDPGVGAILRIVFEGQALQYFGLPKFFDPFAQPLPEEPVQIGSTWVREGTINLYHLSPTATLTHTSHFEVLSFKDHGPYRCVKIEMTTESDLVDSQIVEVGIPGIGTATFTATAHTTGSSIMYFAFEAIETGELVGKPVFVRGNSEIITTMRAVDVDTGKVATADMTMNVITQFREIFCGRVVLF